MKLNKVLYLVTFVQLKYFKRSKKFCTTFLKLLKVTDKH